MRLHNVFFLARIGVSRFSKYCVLVKKILVTRCLSCEKGMGYNLHKEEWEGLYQKIEKEYKEIRIHRLWSTRIGEYIVRYLDAVEDVERNAKRGILDVFILTDCINHNARLSKIMGRNICIIDETNVDLWKNILCQFPKVEFAQYWNDYSIKTKDRFRSAEKTKRYFNLTVEEEEESYNKMEEMNLHTPFVCISSRDFKYLTIIEPDVDCSYHNYRDSDINKLKLAADYLNKRGIKTVRMGRNMQSKVNFKNCIDYANEYYDELLDITLSKECKFYLGDAHGLSFLPMVLNRPVALKNFIPVFLDSESFPYNPNNLYIFKKYLKKDENRFLSINEMMQIEKKVRYNGNKYIELGIEVIENSEEEILDLAMEMNARLDGEWIEKEEDIQLQNKYQEIYQKWCRQEKFLESATLQCRVGSMFLKKNSFLLD